MTLPFLRSSRAFAFVTSGNSLSASLLHRARVGQALRTMAQEFKVKELTSLNLKDGEMKQIELEGVEGGNVLLANSAGKIHATSSNCTHFGAPLAKGVLDAGKVTCPWHGACFHLGTGDVEDAPALDALAKYEVFEKGGAVYIRGDEASIKASRRQPGLACQAQGQEEIVVLGGGSGAIGFVQSLRENGSKTPVTIISKDESLPIDRTKLSKALIPDANKLLLRPQEWYSEASIKTITDEVTSVDFRGKSVVTTSGKSYPYTKLILATGGTPKRLPLPGFKDLRNVFVLRKVHDVQAILNAVGESKGKRTVIVGSSFIGMEVGNSLAKDNKVTIIGMENEPLEAVMGQQIGAVFRKNLEKNGVNFKMGASVDKATPSHSDASKVGAVHLKDGTVLEADLVVLGVGVAPATEYLKASNIKLEQDGSILTDEAFSVSGLDGVYAIGDIARFPYHGPGGGGTPVRIEHWNVAQNAGRAVGRALAKPGIAPLKQFIPVFWSALGAQLRYCGNTPKGYDDMIVKGKPEEGSFAAYYTKGDTVVAVATMAMDPLMAKCKILMADGRMLGKSELQQGQDPLAVA